MSNILRIDASMRVADSVSRQLSERVVARLGGGAQVRDLAATPVPAIDEAWIGANFTPAEERSEAQRATLALSDELIAELQAADTLVIGAPIYNFSVPAALKAWIDQICRAGVTFRYTENGPEGLLSGKRAVVVVASGGVPVDSPVDFATPYLRQVLAFVGITDVTVVAADAMMTNPDSLAGAEQQADAIAA